MQPFFVYTMKYAGGEITEPVPDMIPLRTEFDEQYLRIYNECFYEMRRALDIRPYNVYACVQAFDEKRAHTFLLTDGETIIGSVACCGMMIDDLIVNPQYRRMGYGKQLLTWAIRYLQMHGAPEVMLQAAAWNQNAVQLYLQSGFVITEKIQIGG
ncbi:MAG: GNAT family N-acetyltransferase [Oscillospiraceae bacterium]|nr:GNAT family N-acetyltransferase [Oscillospiraceae bacterium]MCR4759461.1 GNAT family N-acetyltransferase [Oscillospiraceae bacterium]